MHDFSLRVMSCAKLLRRYMRHPRHKERWRSSFLLEVCKSGIMLLRSVGHMVEGTSGVEEKEEGQASLCPMAVCISCSSSGIKCHGRERVNEILIVSYGMYGCNK